MNFNKRRFMVGNTILRQLLCPFLGDTLGAFRGHVAQALTGEGVFFNDQTGDVLNKHESYSYHTENNFKYAVSFPADFEFLDAGQFWRKSFLEGNLHWDLSWCLTSHLHLSNAQLQEWQSLLIYLECHRIYRTVQIHTATAFAKQVSQIKKQNTRFVHALWNHTWKCFLI